MERPSRLGTLAARVLRLQPTVCAGCGMAFNEGPTRQPCRRCGSINRIVARSVTETLGAVDRLR